MNNLKSLNENYIDNIVEEVIKKIKSQSESETIQLSVGISNRHVHLSSLDLEILFGRNYELNKFKDLSQTGQYAAKEMVTIIGTRGTIENVRILGPQRPKTQIELLAGDMFKLGIKAPIRESGDLDNTPGIALSGPKGIVKIDSGVIIAKRHIHMDQKDAQKYGIVNKQSVKVKTKGEREIIFNNVVVRVDPSFETEFHVDIEEGNAAGLKQGDLVYMMT